MMNKERFLEAIQWLEENRVLKMDPMYGLDSFFSRLYMWKIDDDAVRIVLCHGVRWFSLDSFSDFSVTTRKVDEALKFAFSRHYEHQQPVPVEEVPDLMKLFKERIPDF